MNYFKILYHKAVACTYTIGIVEYSDSFALDPDYTPVVHWIKGIPIGHWYADPFIVDETEDSYILFVEDYTYKRDKAQISKLTVSKMSYRVTEINTVLRLDTHLSFPAILGSAKDSGELLFYPENCKSGQLGLYAYDQQTSKFVRTICPYPITDATILEMNGRKVIFGTIFPNDNGKELMIFPYYEDECPKEVQPLQIVAFADKSARNAGQPFRIGDNLYRPAQSSNLLYGECVVIQRMDLDAQNRFSFHEVKRIYSPSRRYDLTFHTFNVYKDKYVAVDASGYRFGLIGRFLKWLSKTMKKCMA